MRNLISLWEALKKVFSMGPIVKLLELRVEGCIQEKKIWSQISMV